MKRFDYVVVGGGSAGCVVASRLSEDSAARVMLLEAGAATGPAIMAAPSAWPALIGSEVDWGDRTVPQTAMDGAMLPYPRGKVLGGSSSINAMAHLRAHRSSYDEWAAAGATGWGYDNLLPFFRRTESAIGRDRQYRGATGPMKVSPAPEVHPITHAALEAATELGYPISSDLNGAEQEGVGWQEITVVDGARQSAADAYLRPVLDRRNLTVVTGALAHRLLITAGNCTGVEYSTGGEILRVEADSEVILTAGSIGSAQLLLLSGIGPAAELRALDIDLQADLPGVGRNLQDHCLAGVVYSASRPVPDGVNNHGDLIAVVRSNPDLDAPDVQLLFMDLPFHPPTMTGPQNGYTIGFSHLRPHSRGSLALASADPTAAPLIDPAFLTDERDMTGMVTALELARGVGESRALADWRDRELLPGTASQDADELRAYLRMGVGTYFHPVGTCRMGSDPQSVVDPQLRVHGTNGLRVADASVMPTLVAANPNATVLAIAERAAAMIYGRALWKAF
jgi:choline dehydrogenase